MVEGISEFTYRLAGNSALGKPGGHSSNTRGPGMSFVAHARLFDQPDPRRIDLKASIASVPRQWLVRSYKQRSATAISVIVDVSRSMHFASTGTSKLSVVADFVEALGYSAYRMGDSVSLQGFDSNLREDIYTPPRTGRGTGIKMAEQLRELALHHALPGDGSGLDQCAAVNNPARSGLVFIASDFHWSLENLESILDKFAGSLVVPIVVWDKAEIAPPEDTGLLNLRDMSTKQTSSLWLSSGIRDKWIDNVENRREQLRLEFSKRDFRPFFVEGNFQADALSKYFIENIS